MSDTPLIDSMISKYQDANPERFNRDFILLREMDSTLDFIEYNCRALEIIEGIQFLGCEIISDETKFPPPRGGNMEVEDSRFILARLKFRISAKIKANSPDVQTEEVAIELYFPKLVNDFFYRIRGATYSALYQLVDNGTYSTNSTFTLKTLFMPVIFRTDSYAEFESEEGFTLNNNLFVLDAFKQRNNLLRYYFAKFGMEESMRYLGLEMGKDFYVTETSDSPDPSRSFFTFQISGKMYLQFDTDIFTPESHKAKVYIERLVVSLIDVFNSNRIPIDKMNDREYWLRVLGRSFTKNSNMQLAKAESVLLSLERVLDECTKTNLIDFSEEDKVDIYSIMSALIWDFDSHVVSDNMEITEKRIRLNEYLIYPVISKFTKSVYRLINSKNVNFKKLKSIFSNFSLTFVIKNLVTSELLRYTNAVNQTDLFAAGLKFSRRGPQSMNEGNGTNISVQTRGLHHSYFGRNELVAASAGDPGMTGTFTPFCRMDPNHPMYFRKQVDCRTIEEIEKEGMNY